MNVQKENVRVLTKDEVIKLSNATKRREFVNSYESWGIWLDIPELNFRSLRQNFPRTV